MVGPIYRKKLDDADAWVQTFAFKKSLFGAARCAVGGPDPADNKEERNSESEDEGGSGGESDDAATKKAVRADEDQTSLM